MSSNKLFDQIYSRLELLDTPELLSIWTENNRARWSDQAFATTEAILNKRGVVLPAQKQPGYEQPPGEGPSDHVRDVLVSTVGWAPLGIFIIWTLVLAPAGEIGLIDTPMSIRPFHDFKYFSGVTESGTFLRLWHALIYIKFGIACYGVYAALTLVRRQHKGITRAKLYLLQVAAWVACTLLLLNLYPYAEILWIDSASVMDVAPNWELAFRGYMIRPGWELFGSTLNRFASVLGCAVLWYVYFSRSRWLAEKYREGKL